MDFRKTEFITSAVSPKDFIRDGRIQIAFAGKSNVGKSSVINCLAQRKGLARVGSAPGKTIHVNYFLTDDRVYLTDLPGYGYAKVSKAERDRWGKLMEAYFSDGTLLSLGILIVDARHAPTADDVQMYEWFTRTKCPMILVANKADKLKNSELAESSERIRRTLSLPDAQEIILFSAEKGTNRELLISAIESALTV